MARDSFPSRPALPASWKYASGEFGTSRWTTSRTQTAGISGTRRKDPETQTEQKRELLWLAKKSHSFFYISNCICRVSLVLLSLISRNKGKYVPYKYVLIFSLNSHLCYSKRFLEFVVFIWSILLIVLSSMVGFSDGRIPLTLILVLVFYLGQEIYDGLFTKDNISHITHIIGGLCGCMFGFALAKKRREID